MTTARRAAAKLDALITELARKLGEAYARSEAEAATMLLKIDDDHGVEVSLAVIREARRKAMAH